MEFDDATRRVAILFVRLCYIAMDVICESKEIKIGVRARKEYVK